MSSTKEGYDLLSKGQNPIGKYKAKGGQPTHVQSSYFVEIEANLTPLPACFGVCGSNAKADITV